MRSTRCCCKLGAYVIRNAKASSFGDLKPCLESSAMPCKITVKPELEREWENALMGEASDQMLI